MERGIDSITRQELIGCNGKKAEADKARCGLVVLLGVKIMVFSATGFGIIKIGENSSCKFLKPCQLFPKFDVSVELKWRCSCYDCREATAVFLTTMSRWVFRLGGGRD